MARAPHKVDFHCNLSDSGIFIFKKHTVKHTMKTTIQ